MTFCRHPHDQVRFEAFRVYNRLAAVYYNLGVAAIAINCVYTR